MFRGVSSREAAVKRTGMYLQRPLNILFNLLAHTKRLRQSQIARFLLKASNIINDELWIEG